MQRTDTPRTNKDAFPGGLAEGAVEHVYADFARELERENVKLRALLGEALEAMWNLAPRIKQDRGGCFGDGGADCECTACRIRREIA